MPGMGPFLTNRRKEGSIFHLPKRLPAKSPPPPHQFLVNGTRSESSQRKKAAGWLSVSCEAGTPSGRDGVPSARNGPIPSTSRIAFTTMGRWRFQTLLSRLFFANPGREGSIFRLPKEQKAPAPPLVGPLLNGDRWRMFGGKKLLAGYRTGKFRTRAEGTPTLHGRGPAQLDWTRSLEGCRGALGPGPTHSKRQEKTNSN